MTAVMPVVDPHTGDVLAMATSKKYGNATSPGQHPHRAADLHRSRYRQAASTYKLFPLLAALSTPAPPRRSSSATTMGVQ